MIRIGTVFSGIGAIEHALMRMGLEHEIVFACDNGDIDILSKEIKGSESAIVEEIENLREVINNIKNEKDEEKKELSKNLDNCEKRLDKLEKDLGLLNIVEYEADLKALVDKYVLSKDNKNKIKLYNLLLDEMESSQNENDKKIAVIKLTLQITKDFDDEELNKIKDLAEQYNFKGIQKELRENCEFLSMLHERINTYKIKDELSKIDDYKAKKELVDNLYKSKENQNQVMKSYLTNYDVTKENFHWNISFLDGKQFRDKIDLFVGGSPCQSFSLVGKQRGLEDTRGTLFYTIGKSSLKNEKVLILHIGRLVIIYLLIL